MQMPGTGSNPSPFAAGWTVRLAARFQRAVTPRILRPHEMLAVGQPQGPHHLASPRRIAFVPDADESLHRSSALFV
jgi:hypothetical protein